MSNKIGSLREFGNFRLDAEKRVLWCENRPVSLALKEIELLCVLTEHKGEVVTKDELLNRVWADSFVEESNLSRHVYVLRRMFKELGAEQPIQTVPRRGYRFAGEVRDVTSGEMIIERRSHTRTVIELAGEPEQGSSTAASLSEGTRSRKRLAAISAMLLVVLVSVTAFTVFRQAAGREATAPIRSLAVLPFTVVDASRSNRHDGVGIADLLINRLSAIGDLKVRPTSAVLEFDGSDPVHFGRRLNVDSILEGTVVHINKNVRVTARLVRTGDNSTIWSGHFEKPLQDEMKLQNEVALQVANALAVGLSSTEVAAVEKRYTSSVDAYRLYVQGRYEWNKRSAPAMKEAERLFRNAIAVDSEFALAYVGLADRLVTSDRIEAIQLVNKALELDPDLAEAHATLGFIRMFHEWKWRDAEAAFRRSIELNPGYANSHHWYAELLAVEGRSGEAISEMQKAIDINPVSHNFLADLGQIYYFDRRFAEAEQYCKKALEIYPDFVFAHEYLFSIYLHTGENDRALEASIRADEINSSIANPSTKEKERIDSYVSLLRSTYKRDGMRGYLRLKSSGPAQDGDSMYVKARSLTLLGDTGLAIDALEKAYQDRAFLTAFIKADPVFDRLRGSDRYQRILRQMELSDEN